MLKQILSEMYIDPDLLAELSEEQKQILFFKMREEQIRRWKEREAAMERKESLPVKSRPKKENGKSVHWKLGADKEVWVWVMGEHHLDKPYDVLCDEIIAERARLKAEQEAEELRKTQSKEFTNSLKTKSQCLDLQANDQETQNKKAAEKERLGSIPAPTMEGEKTQLPSSSSRNIQQMLADSINRLKAYGLPQKKESTKKKQDEEINQIDEERTKQICKSWKEDSEWQASLRKSKAADEKRRSLAKQAREDYKRLSLGAQRGRGGVGLQSPSSVLQKPKRPPLPPKPQFLNPAGDPPKPPRNQGVTRTTSTSAQEDTIRWFKEEQLPLRAGYQKTSDTIAPWFHGILTLTKANELLLSTGRPGSFLIRVSEKIKGYALSHLSEEGCKHFLIDASADSYSFLGVDQLQHATLADLVEYHKEEPITSLGRELLLYPCGQQEQPPDYLELFD
ncbi:SH2 domain-containing protein 4A [Nycticebus coucang]|uniref:SH2 domain-containing protein 4A n=1 Tax=Nycticebus coucang TaxID=9470 RepID=UPI00234E2159|nr:SH2 domain-containing protein 4A [Nycticebus coucang]